MTQSTPIPLKETIRKSVWGLFQKSHTGEIKKIWWRENQEIHFAEKTHAQSAHESLEKKGVQLLEVPAHLEAYPTGMDLQVHLRFPGQASKETLLGGLSSAILGGYDSILTMPNTNPYLDRADLLAQAMRDLGVQRGDQFPGVHVYFTASGTQGMQGTQAADIQALAHAGAAAITDDGWGVKSDEAMENIFKLCAQSGVPFLQHAEMPGHKGVATSSEFQRAENLPEYPRGAESEMIRRDITLLRKHKKARYHVLHVSTKESLEEIRKAKEEGLNVTAEVTPHHLFFSNVDIPQQAHPLSTSFKMNPPLFSPEDRAALREGLKTGLIDFVSTDHAPHESTAKAQGWLKAPFGTRGMETALPTLVSLQAGGFLSKARVEEVFSSVPRKFLAQTASAKSKGIVFVDVQKKWIPQEADFPGVSKNSCFLGAELQGQVQLVAMGEQIFQRNS